jgi:hypothetical protein
VQRLHTSSYCKRSTSTGMVYGSSPSVASGSSSKSLLQQVTALSLQASVLLSKQRSKALQSLDVGKAHADAGLATTS